MLPCFHTYCSRCLKDYIDQTEDSGQFACPLCKFRHAVPVDGIQGFKPNIYITALQATKHLTETLCETCDDNETRAETYCLECKQNFCARCGMIHLKMKMSKSHHLVSEKPDEHGQKMTSHSYCDEHKQEISVFCFKCRLPVCPTCRDEAHKLHNTRSISEFAHEVKKELTESVSFLKSYMPSLKDRLKDVETHENAFLKVRKGLIALVETRAEQLHKEIDHLKEKFITQINSEIQIEEDRLVIFKNRVSEAITFVTSHVAAAKHCIDFGSNQDIVVSKETLQFHLQEASKMLPVGFIPQFELNFTEPKTEETILPEMFGKISKQGTTAIAVSECGHYKVPGMHLIRGIAPISGGKAWVVCGFDPRLHLVSRLGIRLRTIKVGKDIDIDYITSDDHDNVYISCRKNQCIKLLNKDIRIRDLVLLNDFPRGIALSQSGDLLICLTKSSTYDDYRPSDKNVLIKYSKVGSKVIADFERANFQMKYPRRIAENLNGDIYVSDHKDGCVHIISYDGKIKRKYTGTESKKLGEPCGITCDRYGNVIIADYKGNCIHLLDQQGQFVSHLTKSDSVIKQPFSVAVDSDGYLWVGGSNGMVKIFQYLL
ncbi:transcription intermediary factor 1-beta-like [Saccostrea cucullata]|uniref:transcription intermediary factor 1-beta-like n=1 Tax=Saccostrea cuccullata TaxID=36930 RepID=UPI002ED226BB